MHIDKRIPNCLCHCWTDKGCCTSPLHWGRSFFLITAGSPQWIPSSGPAPQAWPGQTKHSFAQTPFQFLCVQFTLPSRLAQVVLLPVGRVSTPKLCPPGPGPALWTLPGGFPRRNQTSVPRGIHRPPFPGTQSKQTSTKLFITVFYSTEQEQHISAQVTLQIPNNLEGDKYSVSTKQRGPSRAGEHLEKQRQKRRNEYWGGIYQPGMEHLHVIKQIFTLSTIQQFI